MCLRAASPSESPTSVTWQYKDGQDEWQDDPGLKLTEHSLKQMCECEITVSLSENVVEDIEEPGVEGTYKGVGSYRKGRPILMHSAGQLTLYVMGSDTVCCWRLGLSSDSDSWYLLSGSAPSICPADPRAAINVSLGVSHWRYSSKQEGMTESRGISVKCKKHQPTEKPQEKITPIMSSRSESSSSVTSLPAVRGDIEIPINVRDLVEQLTQLGFGKKQCLRALQETKYKLDDAAIWLTMNVPPKMSDDIQQRPSNHPVLPTSSSDLAVDHQSDGACASVAPAQQLPDQLNVNTIQSGATIGGSFFNSTLQNVVFNIASGGSTEMYSCRCWFSGGVGVGSFGTIGEVESGSRRHNRIHHGVGGFTISLIVT